MVNYCKIENCISPCAGRGLCQKHYMRWRRNDDPLKTPRFDPPEIRFWRYVNKTNSCWLWTGAKSRGYGHFMLAQRPAVTVKVHRYAYELLRGPIPEGLTIDHLCRTKLCVNPSHLEIVTFSENSKRANPKKSHCYKGHIKKTLPNGRRRCNICEKLLKRKSRARSCELSK